MKILALDSSGMVASAAVLEDDLLLAEYTLNYKQTHSQTLMPMLDEIAGKLSLDLKTVDGIALSAGPGSFTGLRIGSATAKGLGLVMKKPLIEVPTMAAMAYNLYGVDALICPIMDARRGQVYNGLYRFENDELVTVCDQRALSIETLCGELNHMAGQAASAGESFRVIFLGDGVPVFKDKIAEMLEASYSLAPAHVNRQRAASVAALGLQMMKAGQVVAPEDHAPIYLRKSQAERERDEKALVIRPVAKDDISAIMALESDTPEGEGWTESSLETYLAREDTLFLAAEKDGRAVGYVGFLMVPEEGDVLNVAVDTALRRQGIGQKLMNSALTEAKKAGVTILHLEVREGNTPALGLYDKLGFKKDGVRKNYYRNPAENAVTMTLRMEK